MSYTWTTTGRGFNRDGEPEDRAAKLDLLPRLPSLGQRLTSRQIEVLQAAAGGGTYHQIGRRLYITEETVRTQLVRVRRKLGVSTTKAAVARAVELGLIQVRAS